MRRFLVFLCVSSALAFAANPRATSLAKEADRLYRDNRYKEAAETLKKAYELEPVPLYLYNIARAYDQAGELDTALDAYREYVALPNDVSTPELVRKANLAMDRLRTVIAKQAADKKLSDAEKQRLEEEARRAETRARAEAEAARKQRQELESQRVQRTEAESRAQSGRTVATVVTGGVAVAALGASLGFALAAGGNRSAFRSATTLADKQSLQAATQTTAAVTDVSLLIGVAAAITTVILFPKTGFASGPGVALSAGPIQGGAMAGVSGSF